MNVCGVSGAVAGFSNSGCKGGSSIGHSSGWAVTATTATRPVTSTSPIVSGNTVTTPVSAPVNVCGISLALLGFSNAGCVGGAASTISGVGGHSHNGNVDR